MKRVNPEDYGKLTLRHEYFFESFKFIPNLEDPKKKLIVSNVIERGRLLSVYSKWKDVRDKEGKVIGQELVGDFVVYMPLNDIRIINDERLKIFDVTMTCGLFQIYKEN